MTNSSSTASPSPSETQIVEAADAFTYLAAFDVIPTDLHDAVQAGHEEAANHSGKYYPVNAAGLARWMETIRVLRERLDDSDKWTVENPHNRPVMHRDNLQFEVAAYRGDSSTGHAGTPPKLVRAASPKTVESVNRFRKDAFALISVADLLPSTNSLAEPDSPPSGTWILLYHPGEDGIQCEFSLPSGMSSDGSIDGWLVRVLLGTVTEDGSGNELIPTDDRGGNDVLFDID